MPPWVEALRPARERLKRPLTRDFADASLGENPRLMAASILADFAGDDTRYLPTDELAQLILDATSSQLPILLPLARRRRDEMADLMAATLKGRVPMTYVAENERLVRRQANAAEVILALGRDADFWPLLKQSEDPRLRTELVDRIPLARLGPDALLDRAANEAEGSIRQAILLGMETLRPGLSESDLRRIGGRLLTIYESDPDGGVHGAAEWLLIKWGFAGEVDAAKRGLAGKPRDGKRWFVTRQLHTMIVIPAPGRFRIGSPREEPGRDIAEVERDVTIDYAFAISAHEVTIDQFRQYQPGFAPEANKLCPEEGGPASFLTWFHAAKYCRWVSEGDEEGIPEAQRCYPPLDQIGPSMRLSDDYLRREGYRLPTEPEWEYVTRAGSATSRFFGNSPALLDKYAWFGRNAAERTWPVGRLRPNPLGLFDIYGNVFEWCDPGLASAPLGRLGVRGGCYRSTEKFLRSAMPDHLDSGEWLSNIGFRIVKVIAMP